MQCARGKKRENRHKFHVFIHRYYYISTIDQDRHIFCPASDTRVYGKIFLEKKNNFISAHPIAEFGRAHNSCVATESILGVFLVGTNRVQITECTQTLIGFVPTLKTEYFDWLDVDFPLAKMDEKSIYIND